ncbi:hypothetical protein Poli38472_002118 [Pythium oligandrum]|uniref:glucan endo-1,3-beta-D-glucosidase n=1 Tax=Pythium oligandrum TaxID=41045 RepID=A0A8K1CJ72_PYTOL|nr:hypothetical protein Poli38472_002118 [Pythium oligandrum]|eukprot:TMW63177.1 hypothetical protein Poli38472_002118 [Pythium oligandrum]
MKLWLLSAVGLHAWLAATSEAQDTWESGDLTPPQTLVPYSTGQLSLCTPRNIDIVAGKPIPTNTWWGNLITCDPSSNVTQPIWPNPFAISVETVNTQSLHGFAMGYPFRYRYFGNLSPSGEAPFYGHVAHKEVILSATEFAGTVPIVRVTDWSDLGVSVALSIASGKLESNIVSGMAFVTGTYTQLSPRIGIQVPMQSINGLSITVGRVVTGRKFLITTVSNLQWVIYTNTDVSLTIETNQVLRTSSPFTGTMRVAPVVTEVPVTVYDMYKDCIVLGGDVAVVSDAQYQFQWRTMGDCTNGLFHYALPHQMETIDASTVREVTGVSLRSTVRGQMRALVTRTTAMTWLFNEPASIPITFYPRYRLTTQDASQQNLLNQLVTDIQSTWSIATTGSFYFNGKAAQKYASLCLMANDPTIVGSDITPLRRCLTKLAAIITPFLDNSWTYKLNYDRVYGGIVSSESFTSGNLNADFGNTVYNDHHYHYGYWVYTAAVMNYLYPKWTRIDDLNRMTRLLLRDVATPNSVDPFFPKFRHYDWYRGHSYSHGVTTFADGKDEESTSEDVNFAYAMYLYGQATGHARMTTISRMMIKVTSRAIQRYFLMEASSTVHPDNFKTHKAPGILFDNKVDYATWFSAERYCIHGIQMIPITPITDFVRTRTFIQEEWDTVLSKEAIVVNGDVSNPWLSLLYANYARVNRAQALPMLQKTEMDDGLTRSWALYMALQLY